MVTQFPNKRLGAKAENFKFPIAGEYYKILSLPLLPGRENHGNDRAAIQ
ncbi:hypothetical protein IQ249_16145 [Lusitaniella coriacea LEGE 07157]|uniref:Uncharacterized protein n=1 Tax=Lusitaniella coriacea LEGE 07157 TaxID=945747 RepID=A0A8J7DY80_9CYAN|nr:hypothetical protein [Lusitaniella coriacea]MBE9117432.1 hypothetical protein [Lusitaniella coriacea LEGE 07157]